MMNSVRHVSMRDRAFASRAFDCAQKSTMLMRHGCVAVANGRVISSGYNHERSYSSDGFLHNTCSCHAEIHALRKIHSQHRHDCPIKGQKKGHSKGQKKGHSKGQKEMSFGTLFTYFA